MQLAEQYAQQIADARNAFLKGLISYGELLVKVGHALMEFQIKYEQCNSFVEDWEAIEQYVQLRQLASDNIQ